MQSTSHGGLGNILNKVCQNETASQADANKEPTTATNTLNDLPDPLQEVEKHRGESAVEDAVERIKMAKNGKEKQSDDLDRAGFKCKLESEEKPAVKKEARMLELDNQLATMPLPHIPLKSLMDVEIKLVYADEEDITYEFIGSTASTSTQPMCRDVERVDSLSAPHLSLLPQIDKWLQVALKDASACYRQKKYAVAAGQFRTALELCSKGAALGKPFDASPQDISSIASFIETKLVTCYLRMRKPDLALNHSHRSIILNPSYFRNHLRQAAVFRWLERYSEAARSAMTADYMYWLSGGSEQHISKLIKLYWQAMIEEAIIREESFSVMYTPFAIKAKADKIDKMKEVFAKRHPDYVEYIYTDPHGFHVLPQTVDWAALPPQQYLLTLGFKNKDIGKFLEKVSSKKLPSFSEHRAPFSPLTREESVRHLETVGKKILPVMDFIRGTKLTESFSACSGVIEKLQYASLLSRLQRVKEQSQVINQAMAELATIPYLQDISQQDAELDSVLTAFFKLFALKDSQIPQDWNVTAKFGYLSGYSFTTRKINPVKLQSLMADAMDTLEGRSDRERVWNKIQKVGIIEDFLYQVEDSFLKTKKLRTARRQKMKMKRLQSIQQH